MSQFTLFCSPHVHELYVLHPLVKVSKIISGVRMLNAIKIKV